MFLNKKFFFVVFSKPGAFVVAGQTAGCISRSYAGSSCNLKTDYTVSRIKLPDLSVTWGNRSNIF